MCLSTPLSLVLSGNQSVASIPLLQGSFRALKRALKYTTKFTPLLSTRFYPIFIAFISLYDIIFLWQKRREIMPVVRSDYSSAHYYNAYIITRLYCII
jgi:hypothetical protein